MKKLQPEERAQLVEEIVKRNAAGLDTIGTSIRRLRLEVTGLDQETFASMCKMSTKSLYELESGKSNPKLSTLEAVLRLFGVRMGMVMTAKIIPSRLAVGWPRHERSQDWRAYCRGSEAAGKSIPAGRGLYVEWAETRKSPASAKSKKAVSKPVSPRAQKSRQEKKD